jgi:hypothetical protein
MKRIFGWVPAMGLAEAAAWLETAPASREATRRRGFVGWSG